MAFHYKDTTSTIDALVTTIMDELKNVGGYTGIDAGYDVVRDPNTVFELDAVLEATDKRFLQFELGENGAWDSVTDHVMDAPKISLGHVLYDGASADGGVSGIVRISYDETAIVILTDYTANGANYRRCLTYIGLTAPLDSTDECLVMASTLPRGATTQPTNDTEVLFDFRMMRDISGALTKPVYASACICGECGVSSGVPIMRVLSSRDNKRRLPPIYIYSDATNVASGENAGLRAYFYHMYAGGSMDAESHGEKITMTDSKQYMLFIQTTTTTYVGVPARLWVRVA